MNYTPLGEKKHSEARSKQVRENHPRWKGRIKRAGYWYHKIPEHPFSGKQGYVAEHRLVMEKKLLRFLFLDETVHHIDGDKENNHPDNLELYATRGQHTLQAHPEHIEKLRTMNIGKRNSPSTEFKKGIRPWNTGKIISDTTKICKAKDCERSAWYKNGGKKGYCSKHIQTLRREGFVEE